MARFPAPRPLATLALCAAALFPLAAHAQPRPGRPPRPLWSQNLGRYDAGPDSADPRLLAIDDDGRIYVALKDDLGGIADRFNSTLYVFDARGRRLYTTPLPYASRRHAQITALYTGWFYLAVPECEPGRECEPSLAQMGPTGAPAWRQTLATPFRTALADDGGIYAREDDRLALFAPHGGLRWVRTLPHLGRAAGGPFARDAAGALYTTEVVGNRLLLDKLNPDGTAAWTAEANLTAPSHLAVDARGNVYLLGEEFAPAREHGDQTIVAVLLTFRPDGTLAVRQTVSEPTDDVAREEAPAGVEIDAAGHNILRMDSGRVWSFQPTGELVWQRALQDTRAGAPGFAEGPGGTLFLGRGPTLALDPAGNALWTLEQVSTDGSTSRSMMYGAGQLVVLQTNRQDDHDYLKLFALPGDGPDPRSGAQWSEAFQPARGGFNAPARRFQYPPAPEPPAADPAEVLCRLGGNAACADYGARLASAGGHPGTAGAYLGQACAGGVAAACDTLAGIARARGAGATDTLATACMAGAGAACGPMCDAGAPAACYRACTSGAAGACVRLGGMLRDGSGVTADAGRAAAFYNRGCTAGSAAACARLGDLAQRGQGVAQDPRVAAGFYQQACSAGDQGSCQNAAALQQQFPAATPALPVCRELDAARWRYNTQFHSHAECDGWEDGFDCLGDDGRPRRLIVWICRGFRESRGPSWRPPPEYDALRAQLAATATEVQHEVEQQESENARTCQDACCRMLAAWEAANRGVACQSASGICSRPVC